MRVLQLVTQDRGGPVDHAVDVAGELARLGHDSRLAGPPGGYVRAAAERGVTWHEVRATGKLDAHGWRAADALLRRVRPDLVHCQDRRAGLLGRLAARRCGVAAVYTLHGVEDSLAHLVPGNLAARPPRRGDALRCHTVERWLARVAPGPIVVPCAALRRYAVDHMRLPGSRVRVVPNGVDAGWLQALPADAAAERPAAMWVGLMKPVKRLPALLDAAAQVPDLRLLLVGDGPLRPAVQQRIDRCGLQDRVSLLGYRDDPRSLLASAQLFVLPSAAEACPLALLQAMALGLPAVATAVGGVPEIVRDGTDGLLVPAGAPAELAGALRRLAGDAALRGAMGASARARVAARFTLERTVAALLDVYREAAA